MKLGDLRHPVERTNTVRAGKDIHPIGTTFFNHNGFSRIVGKRQMSDHVIYFVEPVNPPEQKPTLTMWQKVKGKVRELSHRAGAGR